MAKRVGKPKSRPKPKPKPGHNAVRSQAAQIDRELAARAIQARAAGETPNATELAALRRWEKTEEEERRWRNYESIPKKHWVEMSGRQPKVINEQAGRYGIPFDGRTISLPAVVRAIHGFLAKNAHKLAADDAADNGRKDPAQQRYRLAAAELLELELSERKQRVLARDEIHRMLGRVAAIIRGAGDTLQKRFGQDAHAVLMEALDDAEHEIRRHLGNGKDEANNKA